MRQATHFVTVLIAAVVLAGCTHDRGNGPPGHYAAFNVAPPDKNSVEVCHAYTCDENDLLLPAKDVAEIATVMRNTKRADTPFQERRAIAYAIARIEIKVGDKLGIKDRAGMEFGGTGDPTQQDCVDEATNTTSYLVVLQSNGLLKYHTVKIPLTKGDLLKATCKATRSSTGRIGLRSSGEKDRAEIRRRLLDLRERENPAVVEVEDWYIKDINNLPKATN